MAKDISYYKQSLLTLRKSLDVLLEEMDKEQALSTAPPRKRRNLKQEEVSDLVAQMMTKTWSKPKELKKKRA